MKLYKIQIWSQKNSQSCALFRHYIDIFSPVILCFLRLFAIITKK